MKEAKIQVHSLADSKCQTLICVSLDDLTVDRIKSLAQSTLAEWIAQTDYTMYNAIITNLLLPNLLKPIPQILTQQIRNFAKCINRWMVNALHGYSGKILSIWQLGKMNKTPFSRQIYSTEDCSCKFNVAFTTPLHITKPSSHCSMRRP